MNTTAKYIRLSSEDSDLGQEGKTESNSVTNQRNLLDAFINRTPELADTRVIEFCDDGWSGKNFERPAVQEMIAQVRAGQIQCIIVKDLSRFGRDYLTVGNYISCVFPFLGVRFIAVNDGFDSIRPADVDSLETSFKTLLYDLYSRDLSRKVRSAKRQRAERGDFLSPFAPYLLPGEGGDGPQDQQAEGDAETRQDRAGQIFRQVCPQRASGVWRVRYAL